MSLKGLFFVEFLGVIPEAYIVPVSISYDKLVDGNFVKEQMVCIRVFLCL